VSDDRQKKIEFDADKRDALLALLRYARDELDSADAAAQHFVDMAILYLSEDVRDKISPAGIFDEMLTIQ
jgi:hypothetical protein